MTCQKGSSSYPAAFDGQLACLSTRRDSQRQGLYFRYRYIPTLRFPLILPYNSLPSAQFTYTVAHPEITHNDMLDLLIKRELTRTIGSLNNEILEEIDASMEGLFGIDNQWKEVGVFDSLTRTVGRAANRVFVGKELCKFYLYLTSPYRSTHIGSNMDFVMAGVRFARDISVSSYILHLFPKFLKP